MHGQIHFILQYNSYNTTTPKFQFTSEIKVIYKHYTSRELRMRPVPLLCDVRISLMQELPWPGAWRYGEGGRKPLYPTAFGNMGRVSGLSCLLLSLFTMTEVITSAPRHPHSNWIWEGTLIIWNYYCDPVVMISLASCSRGSQVGSFDEITAVISLIRQLPQEKKSVSHFIFFKRLSVYIKMYYKTPPVIPLKLQKI